MQMNLVFISIIVATILQRFIRGFSWLMILSYIGRAIFLTRAIGAVVNYKVSLAFEGVHLAFLALDFIMNGIPTNWPLVLFDALMCVLVAFLIFIDNAFYLYIVEDDDETGEE